MSARDTAAMLSMANGNVKSRRSMAQEGEAMPAKITVHYEHLPSESRQRLDKCLQSWVQWHSSVYLPGYVSPEVATGQLTFEPGLLSSIPAANPNALSVWEDKPRVPAGEEGRDAAPGARPPPKTPVVFSNLGYERAADVAVPRYDRGTEVSLHPRGQKRSAADMEGDAAEEGKDAGREEGGAEIGVGEEAVAPSSQVPASEPRPFLRARRCFNCGSYSHNLSECWFPLDRAAVAGAREVQRAAGGGGGGGGPGGRSVRYFEEGAGSAAGEGVGGVEDVLDPAARLAAEFPAAQAGRLSQAFSEALGVPANQPPPWLGRMAALGLPPDYGGVVRRVAEESVAVAEETAEVASHVAQGAGEGEEDGSFIPMSSEDQKTPKPVEPSSRTESPAQPLPAAPFPAVVFAGINGPVPEAADAAAWRLALRPDFPPSEGGKPGPCSAPISIPARKEAIGGPRPPSRSWAGPACDEASPLPRSAGPASVGGDRRRPGHWGWQGGPERAEGDWREAREASREEGAAASSVASGGGSSARHRHAAHAGPPSAASHAHARHAPQFLPFPPMSTPPPPPPASRLSSNVPSKEAHLERQRAAMDWAPRASHGPGDGVQGRWGGGRDDAAYRGGDDGGSRSRVGGANAYDSGGGHRGYEAGLGHRGHEANPGYRGHESSGHRGASYEPASTQRASYQGPPGHRASPSAEPWHEAGHFRAHAPRASPQGARHAPLQAPPAAPSYSTPPSRAPAAHGRPGQRGGHWGGQGQEIRSGGQGADYHSGGPLPGGRQVHVRPAPASGGWESRRR